MTEQEYLAEIAGRKEGKGVDQGDYPAVVRTTDPLLIRISPVSLLVDNTNFYAKIKIGLAFNGYYIYSSGLGTPIAEVNLDSTTVTEQTTQDGTQINKVKTWSEDTVEKMAKDFLDHLEARIAIMPSTNAIKEAIDRFCWQMHYDITKTARITPPEYFAENIVIDRVDPSGQIPDAQHPESQIETFKGYTMYNSIIKIASNIKDDDLDTYTLSRALREDEKDNNNNIVKYSHSVAISLREDTDDDKQSSVSQAVHDQTDLEAEQFDDISNNKLGDFGSGGEGASAYIHKTLYGAIGAYAETDDYTQTVTNGVEIVSNKIGGYSGDGTGATIYKSLGAVADYASGKTNVFGRLYEINDNVSDVGVDVGLVSNKLGNFTASDTLASRVGTSGDTESATSLFGKIAGVKGDTNCIGRDATTSSKLWYDVLHYSGTQDAGSFSPNSMMGKVNTIYTKINDVYLTAGDTGQTLPSIRSWSSNGHWGT